MALNLKDFSEALLQDVLAEPAATYNDPLLPGYWHLGSATGATKGINVTNVWDEFRGAGILVAIVDDGVDYDHLDLLPHYGFDIDYDARDGDLDAFPSDPTDRHGTSVAGVVGAALNNAIGGAGVAPEATLVGYRIGFNGNFATSQLEASFDRADSVDVVNNSWAFDGIFTDSFDAVWLDTTVNHLQQAIDDGRGGLGTVFVFAAGNGRSAGQDVNYHSFQNYRGLIAVAATDSGGNVASFSTPGDAILVSAPGVGIQTTDRVGAFGYSGGDFATLNGTSFSSPTVAGVVALMLDANPGLGWRDVQEILASTAIQTGAAGSWSFNHATNWNGGAMHVSSDFGFGLTDAMAAVRVAESWHGMANSANEMLVANQESPNAPIPDVGTLQSTLVLAGGLRIDHVELELGLLHTNISQLEVVLTSPSGTQSVLFNNAPTTQDHIFFTFSTTHDWGESADGTWILSITDSVSGTTGTLLDWAIRAYGDLSGNDTYVYTDEFGGFVDASRLTLADASGIDGINTAAIASNATIDLRAGFASLIDGKSVTIAAGTVIENADTGDGNDTLIGNDAANWLRGWRGNDTLDGSTGADTLEGGPGNDRYYLDTAGDMVNEASGAGIDTVFSPFTYGLAPNFEHLALTGTADISGTGNDLDNLLTGNDASNTLEGWAGNDLIYGFDPNGPQGNVNSITATRVAAGLGEPLFAVSPPGDLARLFIVEKGGQIKILNLATQQVLADPFLNLTGQIATGGEQGLLGLAFHPDYAQNGYFYVNLINPSGDTEIRRYQVSAADPNRADAASATPVITIDQPAGLSNHKAGWLDFGRDGYLYAALGDGGGSGDPGNNAQNMNSLLGKMLRLDIDADGFPGDATRNYAIPADNPFAASAGADEIWALGLRNPWRPGFDRGLGDLYIADVGQNVWEEIDLGQSGANYGWDLREGPDPFAGGSVPAPIPFTDPIYAYQQAGSQSITGGYVYRGTSEGLQGQYFFADFISAKVFTLRFDGSSWVATERTAQITPNVGTINSPASFGEDGSGNLYIVDIGGEVFRLTPNAISADQGDMLSGMAGDDMLFGGSGNDTLDGGAGDDELQGGPGDDLLTGAGENDTLIGGPGNDVYVFNTAFGQDALSDTDAAGNQDIVRFGPGIDPASVAVSRTGLHLRFENNGDAVTVQNWFASDKIERVEFTGDVTVWDVAQLRALSNLAPALAAPIADQSASPGQPFSFQVPADVFADPDSVIGDTLSYGATLANGDPLPAWLSFVGGTRSFSGTPATGDQGTISVKVTATDSQGASVLDVFDLVVGNAPVGADDAIAVLENAITPDLVATLLGNDSDADPGDVLSISAVNTSGTLGAVAFDALAQTLTYAANAAAHDVLAQGATTTDSFVYTVSDGAGGTDAATVTVTITGVNDAPTIANPLLDQSATAGVAFGYTFAAGSFSDVDAGDALLYGATLANDDPLPAWLSFDAGTRSFSGTPGAGDAGLLNLRVTATDPQGAAVSDVFELNVAGGGSVINGTAFSDTLNGTSGNDTINGLAGSDTLNGLEGNDILNGGVGTDTMNGGAGDDSIVITGVSDPGYEVVNGGTGFDSILGSADDDIIRLWNYTGANTVERIDGGAGLNLIVAVANFGTVLNFSATELLNIARIEGGASNDTITGSSGNDVIVGGAGMDNMSGGGGDDTFEIIGTDASYDVVNGGAGLLDRILGSAGDDTFRLWNYTGANTVELIDGGTGLNVIAAVANFATVLDFTNTQLVGITRIEGGASADTITGSAGNERIIGGAGNDTLDGGAGSDTAVYSGNFAAYALTPQADGSLRVATAANSDGTDTIRNFEIVEFANGTYANGVFTPFGGPNTAPSADTDSFSQGEDAAATNVTATLLAGDSDPDTADVLRVNAVNTAGTVGTVILTNAGLTNATVTYQAGAAHNALGAGQTATDTFQYTLGDGNGGTSTATVTVTITGVNDAPTIANPLLDQSATAGVAFGYTFAAGSFSDVDAGDALLYGATLANDDPLPAWLSFDAGTRSFSGTPGVGDAGLLNLRVTATDPQGAAVSDVFELNVAGGGSVINGTAFSDTLNGTSGNDTINGLAGSDTLNGLEGNDILNGGVGTDTMNGGAGDDSIVITGVSDPGYEVVNGGTGFDSILGSADDDIIRLWNYTGANTVERIDGGAGLNLIVAVANFGTVLNFSATELLNIARIEGGASNDTITGSSGNDVIVGGAGMDNMSGGGGDDTFEIIGTDASYDVVNGGAGLLDRILGSAGDDTFRLWNYTGANTVELIDGGTGLNVIAAVANFATVLDFTNTQLVGITRIEGGASADTITGGAGNDTILGAAGNDTLRGNAGNDSLDGGTGTDSMIGGIGDDAYYVDAAGDVVTEFAGQGTDTVNASIDYTLPVNLENLNLTGAALNATGNALANAISGNSAANTLDGRAGADIISGGAGDDIFAFRPGQSAGDSVLDFTGNGAAAGDSLRFTGFGAGATLTQVGATDSWQISYGVQTETIQLVGVTTLAPSDYLFV